MPELFIYLLKGSLITAVFLLFYKILLRQETFFRWSRWYFVTAIVASFLLPAVNLFAVFDESPVATPIVHYIPDLSFSTQLTVQKSWYHIILSQLLVAGMLVMLLRLAMQMIALVKLRRNKKVHTSSNIRIVELQEQINPFSFFNEIYINPALHTEAELQEIIQHEQFHIQQKHTLDILLGEVLTITFWFNPFAWLLKNALKQNLEFLTDKLVLQTGIDAKHYQYNLLKVSGLQNNIAAANHFHFLKLKNRIIMMNKQKSHPYRLTKYLLLVPVVAIMLLAFSERKELAQVLHSAVVKDTVPVQKQEVTITVENKNDNPEVETINVTKNKEKEEVTIVLKNGKKEVYNLKNAEQKKQFEKKYGTTLISETTTIVETPTAAGVTSPVSSTSIITVTDAPDAVGVKEPVDVPLNDKGYYLSVADDNGECVVIVKDKSKKILKAVLLTEWDASPATYEKKYGKIPPASKRKTIRVTAAGATSPVATTTKTNTYTITTAGASTDLKNPLVIVDGIEKPAGFEMNSIPSSELVTVNVLSGESATAVYGEKGKNGVVMITTKKQTASSNVPAPVARNGGAPIYVVDGKVVSKEEVDKIKPANIATVDILKNEKATQEFGEKGKNGVIKITLKN